MSVHKIFFIIILLIVSRIACADEAALIKKLNTDFAESCSKQGFSGAVLIAMEDKILFEKACGLAHRSFNVPNTINTKFNLGSVGKLFTSVAIAQLVQQSKLSLSDLVNKYLANWIPADSSENLTVQDLLIHTSGLGNFMDDGRWKLGSDSGLYVKINDYRPLIQDDKLQFSPGQNQLYSNNGYLLLGALIERVSGIDYDEYLSKNIFTPAGMKNTGLYRLDDPIENRAEGYFYFCKNGQCTWKNNNFEAPFVGSPAGGVYSTVEDVFNFSNALHHAKLLSPQQSQKVLSPQVTPLQTKLTLKTVNVNGVNIDEQFSSYGFAGAWNSYGFAVWNNPALVGHTGGTTGASAFFATTPEGHYTIIILSNVSNAAPIQLYKKIRTDLGWPEKLTNY